MRAKWSLLLNILLTVMGVVVFSSLVVACGTTDEPETARPTATAELLTGATDAPGDGPLTAAEILAHAQGAMDRQSFRGSFAFAPSRPAPVFTYAPGLTLLQDMGGDWPPFLLLSNGTALSSESGTRWLTSPDNSSSGLFFGVISDPRVALRFPDAPEIVGEEAIGDRSYLVVSAGLDVETLLDTTPLLEPHVRVILSFPYPEEANAQELETLGYEVFGYKLQDSAEWEAFKGSYQISFSERADRPGQPRNEWDVQVTAIVQGITMLEDSARQELRAALEAYGAHPNLVEDARVMPVAQDQREYMSQQLQEVRVRLWIDPQSGLVGRMAIGPSFSDTDEVAVGFWGYDDDIQLQTPSQVMEFRRAEALNGVAQRGFHALNEALRHYEEQHSHYPEALTPETVGDALKALGLVWPLNPFNDAPMRHAPYSPGDFSYTSYGNDYTLEVQGWDHPVTSRTAASDATKQTPDADTLEEDLDHIRSLDFPVFWLGLQSGAPEQGESALPPLTLTEAVACPPEPACIWPVKLVYGTEEHGSRILSFLERPRVDSDAPEGEQMEIAELQATVAISKEPLPARADLSVWQATVWLPESVIRVAATTITDDPDGNPFNSELGLTAAVRLLVELR